MAHTAVVILNWNGREFLRKFLPSVLANSKDVAEVIIADNASTDSSIEFLQKNYPEVRVITNRTNGGFARGYNEALAEIDADYFVLLNSDIEVTPNWIEPVIKLMESDTQIAACQPKLLSFYEREKFEYAGAAGGFIDEYGYPFCRGRIFQHLESDHGQYNNEIEIFWATGACMFVRADLYKKFGGFDEDFFAHMEEIDFCWRLKNGGYKIMFCPDSKVYHVGGGTLPKKSSQKTYLNFRNNISLLYKNLPSNKLFPVFAIRFPLDAIAAIKFLIDGGFKDFYAVLRAHLYFYGHFRNLHRKRKMLVQSEPHGIYKGNIVKEFYLNKKTVFNQLSLKDFSI